MASKGPRAEASGSLPPPTVRGNRRNLADQIKNALLDELILSGAVASGDYLPSEAELCRRYDVSRITVRAALAGLNEAGYIESRHGKGSVVIPRPQMLSSGISQLLSVDSYAASQGREVRTLDLQIREVKLDEADAKSLGLPAESPAVEVRRAKALGSVPISWIVDLVPTTVLSRDELEQAFAGSVLDVLANHPDIGVSYADCRLAAVALDAETAAELGVAEGHPAMLMDEVTFDATGRPVNLSTAYMLSEHFVFMLRRR